MSIPAILERDPPTAELPRGLGTVNLVGGNRVRGGIVLTPAWVVVDVGLFDGAMDSPAIRCFPLAVVLSVDFEP